MLDDPALVVEAEDVDASPVLVARSHALEVLDEGLLAVGYFRVVLGVDSSGVFFDGFSWPAG